MKINYTVLTRKSTVRGTTSIPDPRNGNIGRAQILKKWVTYVTESQVHLHTL